MIESSVDGDGGRSSVSCVVLSLMLSPRNPRSIADSFYGLTSLGCCGHRVGQWYVNHPALPQKNRKKKEADEARNKQYESSSLERSARLDAGELQPASDDGVNMLGDRYALSLDQEMKEMTEIGAKFRLVGAGQPEVNGYYKVERWKTRSGKVRS